MTPDQLKESILLAAIQGKLTEQFPSEKSVNGSSVIPESEKYFDIPDNWSRLLIKDIFELVNGRAFKPTDWGSEGLPIVRIQNLNDPNSPYNYFSGEVEDKYLLTGGELLFSWSGTPGTSFGSYEWEGGKAVLNQHIFILNPLVEYDKKYIRYALNGELRIFIEKAHGGVGLKHITKKEFENCTLPLPPIEEQHRIVAKIEELLPYVDRYAEAYEKLEQFNAKFPEDMKKSILQYAIQGKLVEQRPEEGSAEELYQAVLEEKRNLMKKGEVYREKDLKSYMDDDLPDIPETWKWCRLGELTKVITKGSSPKWQGINYTDSEHGILFVTSENVGNERILMEKEKYVEAKFNDMHPASVLQKNDILTNIVGASIGRTAVFDLDIDNANINQAVCIIRLVDVRQKNYILKYLQSPFAVKHLLGDVSNGGRPNLSLTAVTNLMIALPPLEEQHRIVAKIEELLPYCDRLVNANAKA